MFYVRIMPLASVLIHLNFQSQPRKARKGTAEILATCLIDIPVTLPRSQFAMTTARTVSQSILTGKRKYTPTFINFIKP